jgi:hypothetical protein
MNLGLTWIVLERGLIRAISTAVTQDDPGLRDFSHIVDDEIRV